ncbi:MAG: ester cyclase [Acidobacteriota bacterium]|nr:ester cyclase [Acidobacteriota bacterium]
MKLFAMMLLVFTTMPCFADETAINKALARRVYEEGLSRIVAERDLVAVRWTARGTNTGTGNGIPATGRKVEVSGTAIFRFVDGKIAEEWTSANTLGLMKQLGLR